MKGGHSVELATIRNARLALGQVAKEFPELRAPSSRTNRAVWEDALEDAVARAKKTGDAKEEQDEQLVVRLPKSLLERVDGYAEELRETQPGPAWRRSDVVRLLLAHALDAAASKSKRRK